MLRKLKMNQKVEGGSETLRFSENLRWIKMFKVHQKLKDMENHWKIKKKTGENW